MNGARGRPVALVTGASRGIGKACAVALAAAGFDLAITARTRREGEGRTEGPEPRALPGSLETTAGLIEATGGAALPVVMDLLDPASVAATVDTVESQLGPVDLLLANAIVEGPGTMTRFLDTSDEQLQRVFAGNVFAQLVLIRCALRGMVARGHGAILDMTSAVAFIDPPAATGDGGWGLGYAASKGAFDRVAGILHAEHAADGVFVCNVEPGYVITERMRVEQGDTFAAFGGGSPDTIGAVVAWLATSDDARRYAGRTVHAQELAAKLGLG